MALKEKLISGLNYARRHIFGSCVVAAIVWLGFLSEHSVMSILQLNHQKAVMQRQISDFRESIERYEESIDEVSGDRDEMEHYAREKLMMKKPNEDVYLIDE